MDITALLAQLLNPNGSQSILGAPAQAVGDHNNPALLQAQMAQFSQPPQVQQPPQMAQQAPQQPQMPPQAPQGQPAPQPAPQASPVAGAGDFLTNLFAPKMAAKTRTVGWLQEQGLDPGTATVLASDKGALRTYMLQRAKGGGATEFDQRAQAAQQYGLQQGTDEYRNFVLSGKLPEARGGTAEVGLNTITGVDAAGNPVLIQVDKAAIGHQTKMPDGVTISKQPIKLDAGTSWILLDPVTRQPVGQIPKDLAGAAAQTETGKAKAAAAFDLPRIEQNAQQTLDVIQQLKTHPGRATATGASGTWDPRNYLPGTDATNFKVALDQAKGQTFLQAYNSLKGGGSITDIEGAKATAAIARLNTAQSDEEFARALDDFESVIKTGLARAKVQAGLPDASQPQVSPASPSSQDAPPSGFDGDPKLWKFMTPEQRKLWQ